jgi:hypothetical protein
MPAIRNFSRRDLLGTATGLLLTGAASGADTVEEKAVAAAHDEVWRRFISQHGTFFDYAPPDATVLVPTPDECASHKPNALGWSSPIENGAFFGGLYLDALCNKWKERRDAATAKEARTIAGGLLKLAGIGSTPGFVARGISTDGVSHHAASSSDQTFPWFYGLWRYSRSGLPTESEKAKVEQLLERVIVAIEANEWRMPCDRKGFGFFGRWLGGFAGTKGILTGAEPDFDAAARLLLVHRAMHQMTGEKRWLQAYRRLLSERASDSARTRLEVCAAGVPYVPPGTPARFPASPAVWTSASSQAGLKALSDMEDEPAARAAFEKGLRANAQRVAPYIALSTSYDNDNQKQYSPDWRPLNAHWVAQASIEDAVQLGNRQKPVWSGISPRRIDEAERMRDPLFASWIVALSGDRELIGQSRETIRRALTHYRWRELFTSLFFMAECAYYEVKKTPR